MALQERGLERSSPTLESTLPFNPSVLPLELIITLPQPRKDFQKIEDVSNNIARLGLLQAPIVVRLDEEHFTVHLAFINHIWRVNFSTQDFSSVLEEGEKVFYVLLAGERRFRSLKRLRDTGCDTCHETYGEGPCFDRHFPSRTIPVSLGINVDPEDSIKVQLSENIHMAVPKHQEARVYADFYAYHLRKYGKYPLARFAREIGRGEETVRQALKFCSLPSDVQEHVETGRLKYGVACEIARLQDAGFVEMEVCWWAKNALASNPKVEDFRQAISKLLFDRANGQTMMDLFTQEQEEMTRRLAFRRIVAKNLIQAFHFWRYYFRQVNGMFASGSLGSVDSPFSLRSPTRALITAVEEELVLVDNLEAHLSSMVYERVKGTLLHIKTVAESLEEISEEDPELLNLVPGLVSERTNGYRG